MKDPQDPTDGREADDITPESRAGPNRGRRKARLSLIPEALRRVPPLISRRQSVVPEAGDEEIRSQVDRLAAGADILLREASRLPSDETIERLGKLEEVRRRGAERRDLEERTKRENRRSNFTLVSDAVSLVVSVILIGFGLIVTPDYIPFAAIASGLVGGAAGFRVGHRRRKAEDAKARDEVE